MSIILMRLNLNVNANMNFYVYRQQQNLLQTTTDLWFSLIDPNPCVIKHRLHMIVDWPCSIGDWQQTDSITWLSSALKTTYCESSEAWSPSSQETWLWVHCCDSVLRLPPSCDCSMKKLCKVEWLTLYSSSFSPVLMNTPSENLRISHTCVYYY